MLGRVPHDCFPAVPIVGRVACQVALGVVPVGIPAAGRGQAMRHAVSHFCVFERGAHGNPAVGRGRSPLFSRNVALPDRIVDHRFFRLAYLSPDFRIAENVVRKAVLRGCNDFGRIFEVISRRAGKTSRTGRRDKAEPNRLCLEIVSALSRL